MTKTGNSKEGDIEAGHDLAHELSTNDAILHPKRLDALNCSDVPVLTYHRYSLIRDHQNCRGRNGGMLVVPLVALLVWDVFWELLFLYAPGEGLRDTVSAWGQLIDPLLVPISFLMVFRLTRAAIRFWDSRAAMGKIIQTCRDTISTASVALTSPRRLAKTGRMENVEFEKLYSIHDELLDKYARWLCAFTIMVKNFLRPEKRKGWDDDELFNNRRKEIGPLLSDDDAQRALTANHGVLVVLDRLREIAHDICFVAPLGDDGGMHPMRQAALYKQLNTHIDSLSGAFGAMERIRGTPLAFVYVSHLRTFLLLYLFLFNMHGMASFGWTALFALFAANWALLGIEAASVECERPFGWSPNHLPLGKYCWVIAENIAQTIDEATQQSGIDS